MFVWELDLFQQGNTSQQSRTVTCQLAMKIGEKKKIKGEKRERGQEEERDEGEEDRSHSFQAEVHYVPSLQHLSCLPQ